MVLKASSARSSIESSSTLELHVNTTLVKIRIDKQNNKAQHASMDRIDGLWFSTLS